MNIESLYISLDKLEAERRQFIEEKLADTTPLIAVCYDRGIAIVTTKYKDATTDKIFRIHKQIALAGVGILSSIEKKAMDLGTLAAVLEINYSSKDVHGGFLAKTLSGNLRENFFDARTKPVEADFLICEAERGGKRRIFNISYDGRMRESDKFFIISHREDLNQDSRGENPIFKRVEDGWKENLLREEAVNLALDSIREIKGNDEAWEIAVLESRVFQRVNPE